MSLIIAFLLVGMHAPSYHDLYERYHERLSDMVYITQKG